MTVVLNSPGGRVLDGLALFDFLRRLRLAGHYLRVEVFGRAASMGAVLLQAGDERVLGANAFILIHEVHGGMEGTSSQIGDQVGFYRRHGFRRPGAVGTGRHEAVTLCSHGRDGAGSRLRDP